MEDITSMVYGYSVNVIIALAIFIIGRKVAQVATNIFVQFLEKSKVEKTLKSFLENVVYTLLLIVIVLAALNQLGVQTTSFIAILGAASLAIGLAFKSTLSNISAGVMIVIFKPFTIGDYLEVAGVTGTVEELNLFHTIFKTGDNKVIIVPNSKITANNIINYSKKDVRRLDLIFGISYDDDLKIAKDILLQLANDDIRVLHDTEPFVAVKELANSSVNLLLRVWVKRADYWGVNFDMLEKVKLTFDEKGISIPYPKMDIHNK